MRLDFRNVGKGLEAIAGAKKARDLAQESARYNVTEGAYGPGLQENIQQLEGLKAQDPAQAEAYDQAIGVLQRRSEMTAPDYSVASGPTDFATRQEARQAAMPLRAEGLSNVYRRYGDVERADALEARAQEMQRGLAAEERAKAAEARAQQTFATNQTLTGLDIDERTQKAAERQNFTGFSNFAAENPNLSVNELKDAAFRQFKFTPKQWQETVATRLQIETGEMDIFRNNVKKKLQGKNLTQLGSLYNSDPDFDDKTDLAIVPGKGGAVTLNFIDKASGRITSTQSFKNEALATEYLNKQATEPETIGTWMMNLQKTQSGIDAQTAAIRASDATVGLRTQQMQMLRTQAAGNAEAQTIRAEYEGLTPEEQVGPKGQGLIRQFNMANAKAGTPIPLGTAPRAERPALSPADVTARAKALVESRTPSISNPKKPMTMTEAISYVEGGMRNPIAERLDAALGGGGGDPFAPSAASGSAPQQTRGLTQPAAAPARNAPAEPNPYVDARGRPLAVAPAGAPSVASTAIPAAVAAVENTLGTQAAATRYLQAKIARNEPLSPTERARAQQMGLIR
jgi:hypothetical protein